MLRIGTRRLFSTVSTPPAYPYPLFWTKPATGSALAVSFSKIDPSTISPENARIIGWVKSTPSDQQPLPSVSNFTANLKFEDALHETLKESIHLDEGWKNMAFNQKEGYMNVSDQRIYTPWGRVSDPEDLLGSVLLKDGNIVERSYERTPTHRLVSLNGLVQLSETLHAKLVEKLK